MAILRRCRLFEFLAALLLTAEIYAADVASDKYALMALYTYNFAKFTKWPAQSFASEDAPLDLCVLGEDPFGTALAKVDTQKVRGHPLRIKLFPRVAVVSGCHIVFISRSEDWRLEQILASLQNASILTISDIPDFSERGGMITLTTVNNRIRFLINPEAVGRADLTLSSKLLELAQIIDKD